jgi:GH24 family phage-related lysozyme (muramidase)
MVTENMVANERGFEGVVPHMYLNTNGNVTVGVGHLLSDANAATTLPFVKTSDGTAASGAEIAMEFQRIEGLAPGHVASYYNPFTRLRLNQPDIDALLRSDLNETGKNRGLRG